MKEEEIVNMFVDNAVKIMIGVLLTFSLLGSVGTVGAGERGVITTLGAVSDRILGEGLYFKFPFIQSVIKTDIRIQKEQVEASASSKDLQVVHSFVALNYNIMPEKVAKLFQTVGTDYKARIIDPALQESVKAGTARYNAEELITKREEVRETIKGIISEKLKSYGIRVDEFNIINFNFSKEFNDAVEMKVTAEQNALAAKNKLEQVKFEAEQKVAEAEGKAKAIRLEAAAINSNPQIVQLRAIEKWNGEVPTYWGGGALPMINIK